MTMVATYTTINTHVRILFPFPILFIIARNEWPGSYSMSLFSHCILMFILFSVPRPCFSFIQVFFFIYLCCFFTAFALFLSLFFLKISIPSFVGAVLSQFMYSEVSYLRYATTKNDWTFIYTGLSNQTHFNWLLLLMPLILVSLIVAFPSKCSVNSKFQDRSYLL